MYLNRLTTEQKELFMDLCIHATVVDQELSAEERNLIQQYCDEMQLADVRYAANMDFESAVNKLVAISSRTEIRMIVFELSALLVSDQQIDDFEKKFIDNFLPKVQLSDKEFSQIHTLLEDLKKIYEKISQFIFEY